MQIKHLYVAFAIGLGCLLSSCHSDIDLKNIDTTMEARVKLALPIGGFRTKVSDFLGSNDSVQIYLNKDGVLTFRTEFHEQEKFEGIDLSDKLGGCQEFVNLYAGLANVVIGTHPVTGENIYLVQNDSINMPAGPEYTYSSWMEPFEISLKLDQLNGPGFDQRLDSAQLDTANFTVQLTKENFDDLDWNWIDSITLDWGENIKGVDKRVEVLYAKSDGGSAADKMYLNLKNVTLDLVKDHAQGASSTNVLDSVTLVARVKYTIPDDTHVRITSGAGLNCEFDAVKLAPKAFWGWFTGTADTHVEGSFNVDSLLGTLAFINEADIPLTSPEIKMNMATKIAGDFKVGGQLYSIDNNNDKHYAKFDGKDYFDWHFQGVDPMDINTLNDTSKFELLFNNTSGHGEIHRLFEKHPSKVVYSINCNFDEESTPQIRIQNDLFVNVDASVTVPFAFNKGLKIEMHDTIKDIEISQYHIDSLLSSVQIIDSVRIGEEGVWLLMNILDSIPMDIYATLTCLDANNQPIADPELPGRNFILFPETGSDTIRISAFQQGGTLLKCQMTQKRLDLFPKIKGIAYMVGVTDAASSSAGTVIEGKNSLEAIIALTADLHAYLDPANSKK